MNDTFPRSLLGMLFLGTCDRINDLDGNFGKFPNEFKIIRAGK